MALGKKQNIIVGAASVFVGDVDAALPAPVAGTKYRETMDGSADWRNIGFTQDGLEVSTDPSYGEVEVDQLMDAPVIFKDGMGLTISTTMAEATLENLLLAWGQVGEPTEEAAGPTGGGEESIFVESGDLGDFPVERSLVAVGNGPRTVADGSPTSIPRERIYHVYRVLSVEGAGTTQARADAAVIPVTFRALPDDTNGRYAVIRDRIVGTAVTP